MKYYSIRKSKSLNILTFNSNFIDLIKDADGWIIRLLINKIISNIKILKGGSVSVDYESINKIEIIISFNGDYIFNDKLDYFESTCFIDGFLKSNSNLTIDEMFIVVSKYFNRLSNNKEGDKR